MLHNHRKSFVLFNTSTYPTSILIVYFSCLKLIKSTTNQCESFNSGTADKLPPHKGNLNEYISALLRENSRQTVRFNQAQAGIKKYPVGTKQQRHYERIKFKCEQWGKPEMTVLRYLESFAPGMDLPNPDEVYQEPATPTVVQNEAGDILDNENA